MLPCAKSSFPRRYVQDCSFKCFEFCQSQSKAKLLSGSCDVSELTVLCTLCILICCLFPCRVRYILNVTREIDNFFPGLFEYHNIRVYDEEATDLLAYWNDTYKFISKAK